MNILKIATDWAKGEIFSSVFFIIFGMVFVLASIGFWQLGKSVLARAYVIPTLVAGILLLVIGVGLVYTYKTKISNFENAYQNSPSAFVESELAYTEKVINDYKTTVFTIIPIIIAVASLGIMFLSTPVWKAVCITTIAMLVVILLVDGTASTRIKNYNQQLKMVENTQ